MFHELYDIDTICFNYLAVKFDLSVTSQINCTSARCLISMAYLRHLPLSGHKDVALLNDVTNDAESKQKNENYVIIPSLKSETMGKLINKIPGSLVLISK